MEGGAALSAGYFSRCGAPSSSILQLQGKGGESNGRSREQLRAGEETREQFLELAEEEDEKGSSTCT